MGAAKTTHGLEKMQLIFNEIQQCDPARYSECLGDVVGMLAAEELLGELCSIINTIAACRRPSIPSRISNFLRRVFEDVSDVPRGTRLVLGVLSHLVRLTESRIAKVRKNSLAMIRLVGGVVPPEVVADGFLEKICERLFDKEKGVRREALRTLGAYQGMELNPKVKIANLFKDIIRYDPSDDVRSLALSMVSMDPSTYGCAVERCMDTNDAIRKMLYEHCLPRIDLRGIAQDKRVLLMERAVLEREFDAKALLVDALLSTYRLPEDLRAMSASFYVRESQKYLEVLLKEVWERVGCGKDLGYLLEDPSEENTFLARAELLYVEDRLGKDELYLPELESLVAVMYRACLSVIETPDGAERMARIEAMKNLFKIAKLYDFFNETSRKYILSTIHKLLAKNSVEEVVEEAMQMAGLVCDSNLNNLIGSIIKRNVQLSPKVCLMVCKQVMKHIRPVGRLHQAIVDEIVLPNLCQGEGAVEVLEIGFYYVLSTPHHAIVQSLVHNIDDARVFQMCVDLALSCDDEELLRQVVEHVEARLGHKDDEAMVIPVSKMILSHVGLSEELRNKAIAFALGRYYHTQDDHLKQYCSILFFELFSEDSSPLIAVFCSVLEELGGSHRVFTDQALYWIGSSKYPNGSQLLFYTICVYLANGSGKDQTKRSLLGVLEKIDVLGCWDPSTTKKILFCCSTMAKRMGSKPGVGDIIERLMEIDDGEPISPQDLSDVKRDLEDGHLFTS